MQRTIGFCGKGGTGKTTLTALFLKNLLERGEEEILVVDADPNECLAGVLGVKHCVRISDVVGKYEGKPVNFVQFDEDFKALMMLNEQEGYDIIVMGRGESGKCYCMINNLLRSCFERNILTGEYAHNYVLMDCEAGLEHVSRRVTSMISDLIIVTDFSKMGLDTIRRISDVSYEVESEVKNFYVATNRVQNEEIAMRVEEEAERLGMIYLGNIPHCPLVEEFNSVGKNLLSLPSDSKAYKKVSEMLETILKLK
jgi:CO dehydrogenase maturation factor